MVMTRSLVGVLSRCVLRDVLSRALSLMSSITAKLDVTELVSTILNTVEPFSFTDNNDLRLLVDRIGALIPDDNADQDGWIARYAQIYDNDPYVQTVIAAVAYDVAAFLIAAYVVLRDQIPQEVVKLSSKIEERLKDKLQEDPIQTPNIVVQNWGTLLADDDYRTKAILVCRDLVNVFAEGSEIRSYYVTACLAAAERLNLIRLPAAVYDEFVTLLKTALGEVEPTTESFVHTVIAKDYGSRELVAAAQIALDNGAALCNFLFMLDKVVETAHKLSTAAMNAGASADLATWLAQQLPLLEKTFFLIAGAMIALQATTYKNTLVFACTPTAVMVDANQRQLFHDNGGTNDDLVAFGFYVITGDLTTPSRGWSTAGVLSMKNAANDMLVNMRSELGRQLQADNTVVLRGAVSFVIEEWLRDNRALYASQTPDSVVDRALSILLMRVANSEYALEDLLINYLVAIRNHFVLTQISEEIARQFAQIPDDTAADKSVLQRLAVATAMGSVMTNLLISNYGSYHE